MNLIKTLSLVALICAVLVTRSAFAGGNDPLFINLTSDEPHRALMAIMFSKGQLKRGHPVTVFLNDKGVLVASKANADNYKEQQAGLAELLAQGATVIICPMCMTQYGVEDSGLLEGIQLGSPDVTGTALFKDNTKALTW